MNWNLPNVKIFEVVNQKTYTKDTFFKETFVSSVTIPIHFHTGHSCISRLISLPSRSISSLLGNSQTLFNFWTDDTQENETKRH